jgi:hypothetical protein
MRGRFAVQLGRAVAASALLAAWPAAWGASVSVTLNNGGGPFAALAARGTVTVDAYSQQQGLGKNVTVTSDVTTGGVTVNPAPGANAGGFGIGSSPSINASYRTGRNLVLRNLGRTVNLSAVRANGSLNSLLNKASLTMAGDQYMINSNTGVYTGQVKAFIDADGNRLVNASATVAGAMPPTGEAAGRALDPFSFSSLAPIAYNPTLTAEIDLDNSTESGGIEAFATDSSEFSGLDTVDADGDSLFDADGDPLQNTLWFLTAGSDGDTAGTGDFDVDFELNSTALTSNEIAFSSAFLSEVQSDFGNYGSNATLEATEIDEEMDKILESEVTKVGDDFVFNNINIMPTDTMFTPDMTGETYADEVDADISVAPLPGAAGSGMLLIGLIGAANLIGAAKLLRPRTS